MGDALTAQTVAYCAPEGSQGGERNGGAHILCELFPRLDGSLAWIPLLLMLRLWLFDIVGRSVFLKRLLTALRASS